MKASALQTFVAVINGAYVLGEEGLPLDVTEAQAKVLLADGLIVLGVDEAPIPVDPPADALPPVRTKSKGAGVL